MESLRAQLLQNGRYNELDEDGKLILDLPIIEWNIGWKYTSILMFKWLEGAADLHNAGTKDVSLHFDNFEENDIAMNQKFRDIVEEGMAKLRSEDEIFKTDDADDNLTHLIEGAKELLIGSTTFINLGEEFEEGSGRSYLLKSENETANFIQPSTPPFIGYEKFDDFCGTFGVVNLYFSFKGYMKRLDENTAEIEVTGMYYRINDFFDFSGAQSLGAWNQDVYNSQEPTKLTGNSLSNGSFRDFRETTRIGLTTDAQGKTRVTNDFMLRLTM